MPALFRFRTPLGVGWRRIRRAAAPSAPSLREAVFAFAGTATVSDETIAITNATFAMAGIGAVSVVGAGIHSGVMAAAGIAAVSNIATAFYTSIFATSGVATAAFSKGTGQITSTNIIQKPVDYALAGEQDSPVRRGRFIGRGLRNIFRE